MSKLHFKDSRTDKSKNIIFKFKDNDDITIELPDTAGKIVTTNTIRDFLQGSEGSFLHFIKKPNIRENNAGIINPDSNMLPLKVATYKTSDNFVGPHENTEWQVNYENNFDVPAISHSLPDDKKQWKPTVADLGREVFVRYRFTSSLKSEVKVVSMWSDTIKYKTPRYGALGLNVTLDSTIPLMPIIKSGPLQLFGEDELGPTRHIGTRYRIINTTSGVVVHTKELGAVTEYQVPKGVMSRLSKYTIEVTYLTDNDNMPVTHTESVEYSTPNVYIITPSIQVKVDGSNYTANLGAFRTVNSNETHTATSWKIIKLDNSGAEVRTEMALDNDTDNLLSLNLMTLALAGGGNFKVKAKFHSETMESDWGEVKARIIPGEIRPISITIEENNEKIPTIKLSKFEVKDKEDRIKSITINTVIKYTVEGQEPEYIEGFTKDYPNDASFSTFRYKQPMTITLNENEYSQWYQGDEGPAVRSLVINSPRYTKAGFVFLVKAIIHGEKYVTETSTIEFDPTIDINSRAALEGDDLTNLVLRARVCTEPISWMDTNTRIRGVVIDCYKKENNVWVKKFNKFRTSAHDNYFSTPLDRNDFDFKYEEAFQLETFIKHDLGLIYLNTIEKTIRVLMIDTPEITATVEPLYTTKLKIRISGSPYVANPSSRVNKEHAKTYINIYNGENNAIVYETIELTSGDLRNTVKEITVSDAAIHYNQALTIGMVYESKSGIKSEEGKKNINTGVMPSVVIQTPTIQHSIVGKKLTIGTSAFQVTGLEDRSHKGTDWKLYKDNTLIWSSLNDTTNLTTIDVPESNTRIGERYTIKVAHIASNNERSTEAEKEIQMIPSLFTSWGKDWLQRVYNGISKTYTTYSYYTVPVYSYRDTNVTVNGATLRDSTDRMINNWYVGYIGRSVEPGGLATWRSEIASVGQAEAYKRFKKNADDPEAKRVAKANGWWGKVGFVQERYQSGTEQRSTPHTHYRSREDVLRDTYNEALRQLRASGKVEDNDILDNFRYRDTGNNIGSLTSFDSSRKIDLYSYYFDQLPY